MKKRFLIIGTASMVIGMTVNMRLNIQKTNANASLFSIEALTNELTPEEEEILIYGSLYFIPVKSFSQPFQATKYASYINVSYLANLTNITVQVVQASGQIVYSNTVNTVAGGQLCISLTGLSSGDYTLLFTAPNGNSVYGDFEI
ncbi:MAG: DUF3244 domain-containing protein [Bacteroidales bacterium]|nr:DUF3244 domain-containing protein [Bacteroidales bacterium]